MSLIRIKGVTKRYDQRLVLREIFFRLSAGERVGLIGPNGSGKTTLLNLLLKREEPSEGEIEHSHDVKIGYFSQFSELDSESSVETILENVLLPIKTLLDELAQIEEDMGNSDDLDALLKRQSETLEAIEHADGWNWKNRIDTVLTKLGFTTNDRARPLHQLSSLAGATGAALAKILLEEPDVLAARRADQLSRRRWHGLARNLDQEIPRRGPHRLSRPPLPRSAGSLSIVESLRITTCTNTPAGLRNTFANGGCG